MDKNRLFTIGSVILIAAIVLAGWLFGVQPQLAATVAANQDRVKVQAQNSANEKLLAGLKKDYQEIDGLKAQLSALREAVPGQAEASSFVTELNSLASDYQVTLGSIAISDARPYTPPPAVATPPASAAASVPASTWTASTAPGIVAEKNALITPANFVVIPVQLMITGPYANILNFVHGLQTGPRLFLVSNLSSTVSATTSTSASNPPAGGAVDATIGGLMYVLF